MRSVLVNITGWGPVGSPYSVGRKPVMLVLGIGPGLKDMKEVPGP